MINSYVHKLFSLAIVGILPLIAGCSHINVRQLAYETLRQEDCRRNQLEDFCNRNFASEFHEYDLMRRNFVRNQKQHTWRVSVEKETDQKSVSFNQ